MYHNYKELPYRPLSKILLRNPNFPLPIYNYQPLIYNNPLSHSLKLPRIQLGRTVQIPSSSNCNCNCNCNCNNCNNHYNNNNNNNIIVDQEREEEILNYLKSLPEIEDIKKEKEKEEEEEEEKKEIIPPNIVKPIINRKEINYKDVVHYIPPPIKPPIDDKMNEFIFYKLRLPNKNHILKSKRNSIESPRNTKIKTPKKRVSKEEINWWKLLKDFINLFIFYKTALKYTKYAKKRIKKIKERNENIVYELLVLKDWMLTIQKSFFPEFKYFQDFDISYNNTYPRLKIAKHMKVIKSIIQKLMENFQKKVKKLRDIPKNIQQILYKFIKERAYFPYSFLSINQVYRIDFHFYGFTRLINDQEASMILSFLLINGILVQQILLNIGRYINQFEKSKEVRISAKYIGSIIHYLTRDTFKDKPKIHNNFISVLNYFRNHKDINEDLEDVNDDFGKDMIYNEKDEFSRFLVDFKDISIFWEVYKEFVEEYKKNIYIWAVYFCRLIKNKYAVYDPDLKYKKRKKRPPDRKMRY